MRDESKKTMNFGGKLSVIMSFLFPEGHLTEAKVCLRQSFCLIALIVAFWFTLDLVLNVSSSSVFFI
jgi:hypothetical protein